MSNHLTLHTSEQIAQRSQWKRIARSSIWGFLLVVAIASAVAWLGPNASLVSVIWTIVIIGSVLSFSATLNLQRALRRKKALLNLPMAADLPPFRLSPIEIALWGRKLHQELCGLDALRRLERGEDQLAQLILKEIPAQTYDELSAEDPRTLSTGQLALLVSSFKFSSGVDLPQATPALTPSSEESLHSELLSLLDGTPGEQQGNLRRLKEPTTHEAPQALPQGRL